MNLKNLTLFLLFISISISAQDSKFTNNDSLIEVIETTKGKKKLMAILRFCNLNNRLSAKLTQQFSSDGLVLADEFKDVKAKIELLRYSGIAAFTLGDMENSKSTIEKAIELSSAINDSSNLGKSYRHLGGYYFILGDFEKSRHHNSISIEIAEKIGDKKLIYHAKKDIASSYLVQGMFDKSLKLYEEIFEYCNNYNFDCTGALVNRAIAIHNIGKPSEALGYFFEGRNAFLKKKDFGSATLVEHHIGHLLKQTELFEEALHYYGSVKEFYEKSGNINRLSAIHLSMGELMLEMNNLDEAEIYLQKALDFKSENGMKTIGDPLIDLGLVALKRANYGLAFDYFQKAKIVYETTEDTAGIAVVMNRFSMSYLDTKDFKNAEKYALQSLLLNKESGIKRELALSYENLVQAYEGQNKFDMALQAKKELELVNVDLKGSNELLAITKKLVVETLRENEDINVLDTHGKDVKSESNSSVSFWVWLTLVTLMLGAGFYFIKLKNKPSAKNGSKIEYLQKEEVSELLKTLNNVIEIEKPYLKQELTLSGLAELISTSDKKLSALLNHSLSISFYDYINRFRVEAVKEKLELEEYEKYSLVGIAYTCGFNSKSSFYRAFKKETGISPTIYKAQQVS